MSPQAHPPPQSTTRTTSGFCRVLGRLPLSSDTGGDNQPELSRTFFGILFGFLYLAPICLDEGRRHGGASLPKKLFSVFFEIEFRFLDLAPIYLSEGAS